MRALGLFKQYLPDGIVIGGFLWGTWRLFQNTYMAPSRSIKRSYTNSIDAPLEPQLEKIIDEMATYFLPRIPAREFAEIRFYMSKLPDINHIGSTETKPGSYIGIPVNFLYTDTTQVDLSDFKPADPSAERTEELLHTLKESLVLTENAKKFAMSQQVHCVNTYHVMLKTDYMFGLTAANLASYYTWPFVEKGPYALRLAAIMTIFICVTLIGYMLENGYEMSRVITADEKTAKIGEEYIQGAVEYMEKIIQRNKVLRELETDGVRKYDENGFRLPGLTELGMVPPHVRLDRIVKLREQLHKDKQQITEDTQ